VIVGVDGSPSSAVALQWAVDHADRLGEVRPVMTFSTGPFEYGFATTDGPDGRGEPYRSEAILRLGTFLDEHAPRLADVGEVVESRAGPGLVHAAEGSELLVVGTRGWSSRVDLSLGSVGAYCARHSTVPVALIPPIAPPVYEHLEVVVGFDGSAHARAALCWALAHLRRSAHVTVVRAYTSESVIGEPMSPPPTETEAKVRHDLERSVTTILGDLPLRREVDVTVVAGDPRVVLRNAAEGADLLVIGSRGQGVLDRLLLGSVADALVHHPTIPTVVVPQGGRA
jgi:nucleotide-binding universal stress UspA family protein